MTDTKTFLESVKRIAEKQRLIHPKLRALSGVSKQPFNGAITRYSQEPKWVLEFDRELFLSGLYDKREEILDKARSIARVSAVSIEDAANSILCAMRRA